MPGNIRTAIVQLWCQAIITDLDFHLEEPQVTEVFVFIINGKEGCALSPLIHCRPHWAQHTLGTVLTQQLRSGISGRRKWSLLTVKCRQLRNKPKLFGVLEEFQLPDLWPSSFQTYLLLRYLQRAVKLVAFRCPWGWGRAGWWFLRSQEARSHALP